MFETSLVSPKFVLGYSTTIHKSQGLSLGRAVIDLGQKQNPLGGLTYVALSRLRTMQAYARFLYQTNDLAKT